MIALVDPTFKSRLREEVPKNLERILASVFGATAAVVFFWLVLEQFQQVKIAFATTLIFSQCTSMWSTATRALWQHGPLVLMLVIAMLLLQRARRNPALIQFVSIPLAMAYLIRPTASIPIAVITIYVATFHRRWFVRYMGLSLLIGLPWVLFNFEIYGAMLPTYYLGLSYEGQPSFLTALIGNLFSPSRGLFIYSPVLLLYASGEGHLADMTWRGKS